ncbi:unnamed protein product [Chrysoparadoxa australica]
MGQQSVLSYAAQEGDARMVKTLLRRGAMANWREGNTERTALSDSLYYGHVECTKLLLQAGAEIQGLDQNEGQLLHCAVCNSHGRRAFKLTELLLDKGADVNAECGGQPVLCAAALAGHVKVVMLLLDRGAAPNKADSEGSSALHAAAAGGYYDVVLALLARGANPDQANHRGHSTLKHCFRCWRKEELEDHEVYDDVPDALQRSILAALLGASLQKRRRGLSGRRLW